METEKGEKEKSPPGATWTMTVAPPAIPLAPTTSIAAITTPQTQRRGAKTPDKFMITFPPVLLCLAAAELL
jgi:hypothetical protein